MPFPINPVVGMEYTNNEGVDYIYSDQGTWRVKNATNLPEVRGSFFFNTLADVPMPANEEVIYIIRSLNEVIRYQGGTPIRLNTTQVVPTLTDLNNLSLEEKVVNKLYITNTNGFMYYWNGTAFVPVAGNAISNTDQLPEGTSNLYYTNLRVDIYLNTLKGAANGLASLGVDGKVPSVQLPAFVDDVLEFATLAAFPATGESGKIYIAINDGTPANPTKQYRWSGSVYSEISASPGTTDNVPEGTLNLYFTENRVIASPAFVGATASTDGVRGLVPRPLIADRDKYLKGDGTWGDLTSTPLDYITLARRATPGIPAANVENIAAGTDWGGPFANAVTFPLGNATSITDPNLIRSGNSIVIKKTGIYDLAFEYVLASSPAGDAVTWFISVNGSAVRSISIEMGGAGDGHLHNFRQRLSLSVGDVVTLRYNNHSSAWAMKDWYFQLDQTSTSSVIPASLVPVENLEFSDTTAVLTQNLSGSSGSYLDINNGTITLPKAGIFDIEFEFALFNSGNQTILLRIIRSDGSISDIVGHSPIAGIYNASVSTMNSALVKARVNNTVAGAVYKVQIQPGGTNTIFLGSSAISGTNGIRRSYRQLASQTVIASNVVPVNTTDSLLLETPSTSTASTTFIDAPGHTTTITKTGRYVIGYSILFTSNTTNTRLEARITRNGNEVGGTFLSQHAPTSGNPYVVSRSIPVDLVSGDILRVQIRSPQGATITIYADTSGFGESILYYYQLATSTASLSVTAPPKVTRFLSSGTFTPDPNAKWTEVEIQAAGGGSGGAAASSFPTTASCATGGSAGGYGKFLLTNLSGNYPVTIGAPGLAGSPGGNGTSAGNTSISGSGVSITAVGGLAGSGGSATTADQRFGPSGSDVSFSGTNVTQLVIVRGGEASPAICITNGYATSFGGSGGDSMLGQGGPTCFVTGGNAAPGRSPSGFGAGAGGAASAGGNSGVNGANGAPAIVIITEHY